ncbi:MAG: putative lipid II flippase FtsW [Gammaproteobacteria bacterium]
MSQAVPLSSISRRRFVDAYRYDPWLIVIVAAVVFLGLVMVASASIAIAARDGGNQYHFLWRQLAALSLGCVVGAMVLRIPTEAFQRHSVTVLLVGIGLLVAVLIPGVGREVNGSMRWVKLGPLTLQASEPVKLAVIIYVAGFLVRHERQVRSQLMGFIKPIFVVTIVAFLLLLEPDFGAAVVILATVLGMLFLGGVPLWRFAAWGGVAVSALAAIAVLAPYRMQRLMAFRDPWSDPYNTGFQLTQALIAFGRGEWFGVGLGNSVQKLFYLPEVHTDFIFAVIGEELGLAGACCVILLFFLMLTRILYIGGQAEDNKQPFAAYVAYGIGLLISIEAFVNIGVNLGILPTKGLTLPMISYGSNSMVMLCGAVALVLRVSLEANASSRSAPTAGGAP